MAALPANVPAVADVIAEFRQALDESDPTVQSDVIGLLLGLHENNVLQWDREDAARRDDADDRAVADAKRDIDALEHQATRLRRGDRRLRLRPSSISHHRHRRRRRVRRWCSTACRCS